MIKKIMAAAAVVSMLILMLGSNSVICEEATDAVPKLNFKLNADKTTSMSYSQVIDEEGADEMINQIKENFEAEGYSVEKGENPTSVIISKTYPVESGYIIDFSLPYGIGQYEFIPFNDLFVNRYGIKNTSFNSENAAQGQTYLALTIETPVRPAFSNATIRDNTGKINTWQIISGSKNEIYLTFKTYNIVPLVSTIFGIAVLLVLIYLVVSSNRKNKVSQFEDSAVADSDENLNSEEESDSIEDTENALEETDFDAEDSSLEEEPSADETDEE